MTKQEQVGPSMPTVAVVYLRISRDRTGEGLGVERQQDDCLQVAERLGWTVGEIYIDNDVSAMSGKRRPAYSQMMLDLDLGKASAIIAWHPDRLYRKVTDLAEIVDCCKRNNVQIATANAGHVDLATASGRLVAGLLAQVAMYEGEHKAERWVRAWRQAREKGTPIGTGSRMFGYTRQGDIVPEEADIARRMAKDILSGVPILTVSRWLEDEGILTTRGSVWRPGTVRQYLVNPRLAGFSTLGHDEPTGRFDKHRRPIHRRVYDVVGEGQWEPILDRDTWETVRALLGSRVRKYKPRVSILNGLLFCGTCGHRMITSGARGQRTYRCPNRPGMPGCGGVSSYAEPVERIVEAYAKARLDDPSVRAAFTRISATGAPKALAEIRDIEDRILELEGQLDQPNIPVAAILRAIDRSRERLEHCQQQLTYRTPVRLPEGGSVWPADIDRRRQLIDLVVARVALNPTIRRVKYFNPERVQITPK